MGIITWIILGGVSGWLASLISGNKSLGLFGNIAVGIVGAMIGGFLFSTIGKVGVTGFNLYSVFVSVIGAWLLLFIISKISK